MTPGRLHMASNGSDSPAQFELPAELIEALKRDVVPHIVECCRVSGNAFDEDTEHNDNYTLGTYSWRNLYNRLGRKLNKKLWLVKLDENDLRITFIPLDGTIELRVHRCSGETMIPTGGLRAKMAASGQNFLSQGIESWVAENFQLVVGYVFDQFEGLSLISVLKLFGPSPQKLVALPVATLYQTERLSFVDDVAISGAENIATPGVTKTPAPERIDAPQLARDMSKDASASTRLKKKVDG